LIVAVTTIGTYTAPWVEYGVASIYNVADAVLVVNGGYDINDPSIDDKMLQRESKALRRIDIHNKITEVHGTWDKAKRVDPEKEDLRARNWAIAYQHELTQSANAVLGIHGDQAFYPSAISIPSVNLNLYSGYQFFMYEDFYYDLHHILHMPPEKQKQDPCSDAPIYWRPHPQDTSWRQGSPKINADQFPCHVVKAAHLRQIAPEGYDLKQILFERYWHHNYGTSRIGEHPAGKLTLDQVIEIAKQQAKSVASGDGKISIYDKRVRDRLTTPPRPPPVCLTDPLKYVEEGEPYRSLKEGKKYE